MEYYYVLKTLLYIGCSIMICINGYYLIYLKHKQKLESLIYWVTILIIGVFTL